jgi:hypothetical protein
MKKPNVDLRMKQKQKMSPSGTALIIKPLLGHDFPSWVKEGESKASLSGSIMSRLLQQKLAITIWVITISLPNTDILLALTFFVPGITISSS